MINPVAVVLGAISALWLAVPFHEPQTGPAVPAWPQWRGPLATGEAPAADPPVEWSETRNIAWKTAIPGEGASTPIVWGDTIYLQAAVRVGDERPSRQEFTVEFQRTGESVYNGLGYVQSRFEHQFQVVAVNRTTGAIRWRRTLRTEQPTEGRHPTNTWASGSPVTDGEHLISYFGSRGLFGLDLDGNVIWEADLGEMRTRNGWGEGGSPALHGNLVVVTWDQEDASFIAAFDKRTGEERWRQPRDEPTTWATPLIVTVGGRAQVLTNGTSHVRGYDLETGAVIWEGPGLTFNSIPSPVAGNGMAFFTSGFSGAALLAVDLASARGSIGASRDEAGGADALKWRRDRDTPYVSSPLLYGDVLYVFKSLSGIFTVLDAASGELAHGPVRLADIPDLYASPVGAAGRVYIAGRDGAIVVIEHGGEFKTLAVNHLDDGFDASPAVVGRELYLRGRKALYRIEDQRR